MQLGRVLSSVVVVATAGLLGFSPVVCQAEGPAWRIESGDVTILVPIKPGGAFEATTSSLRGELVPGTSRPLALAGEITVELASIKTGISLRDRHLGERLEVSRGQGFDKVVLSSIVLSGADGAGFRGHTEFTGTLLLHGVSRQVTGKGEIREGDSGVRVEAEFLLTLADFEIEPPQYMGVGVGNTVVVRVSFDARPGPEIDD